MKRKVLFPLFGKKEFPAGLKMFLLLLAVFLWSGNTFSQNWDQIIKTVASDRASGERLGASVAISGDYAIVGAPNDGSGSAYIFQKSGANWIQMQKIVASDGNSDDHFGVSVAISGDYAVVGAVYDNENAVNASPLSDAGSAYVFKRTGASWAEEQKIVASDRQTGDYFGISVAISGDYVVVGALLQDLNASGALGISAAGAAYIYKRTLTTWAQEQKIVASARNAGDNFGHAVAISGDYVVVGAINEDQDAAEINTLTDAGSAYVFFRTGTSWAQQQKIVASDRGTLDAFGWSVSISGADLIIGAQNEDEDAAGGNLASSAGSAYVFTRTGTTWAQQQKIVASDRAANDNFANSVSISGDYAIVGTQYEDENSSGGATLSSSGSAYVFSRAGTIWTQSNKIVASDRAADDNFGKSVAISGDYAIVGAPYEDEDAAGANTLGDAGSVYIFKSCGTITGTTSVTNNTCNGGANGTINLTPSGGTPGYTFSWVGGATTEDRTGLAAGTYTVTIRDANGCPGTVSGITITQPATGILLTANSQTNIACFGGNTGSATVNAASNGVAPYTYDWTPGTPTGDGTTTASGLTAGTWTCTVSDNIGCTAAVNFNITQVAAIVVTPNTQTNVSCFGGSNGAAAINTPTGGLGGYSYNWAPGNPSGDGTVSVTGLTAQTYTCTVTDGLGCSKTQTFNLTAPPILNGTTVVTNVACNGGTNGAINLTSSGGAGGYTYNWGGGITTEDRTGLAAGTYAVIITDANACTRNVTGITVTQPTAAVSGTTVVTNVSCNSGTSGAINLTPTGGTGPYTFNWASGPTTEDRVGIAAGTYSVTITDVNACTGTVSGITVTQPTSISGSTVVTNVSCNGGTNGAINLTASGGAGGYTYNWGGGITTEDRTGLAAGTYAVIITDANGCTRNVTGITVTQPTAAVSGTTVVTNVSCNPGTNGAINLTPTGGTGPYTFNWASGPTTEDRTGLAAGTYSVTITDANGCTGAVSGITVTQPTAISVTASSQTNVACNGGSNGAAAINTPTGGTPGYTYDWTPGTPTGDGSTTVTGLTAGTWTCTVTDANGCVASRIFTVTQPTALSVTAATQTNIACNGGATGAAAINTPTGGTPGYTYNWTPGNPTGDGTVSVTGLTAGTWTVNVTDANGCVASQSFTVTQATALSVTAASQTNIACNGDATGAAAINTPTGGTPGYTYDWTPGTPTGDGTVSVTGLTAGTWTVNVTDANGCVASQIFTVTQPTALSVTAATQTNVSCNGGATGAAAINTPTGGTLGYTYDWAPGTPTGDGTVSVTGLTAGTWNVNVTDANGCVASQSFTVTQPTALSVTAATQTNIACNGGATGAAAINTPSGGTPGYTYNWTPGTPTGDGTVSVTGLTAGTWTVNVTDANGCVASQSFTVTEPTALSVTAATQTNIACNGGATGAAAINTPTGGTPGYTYDWAPGTPTGDGTTAITGLTAGTYTVTATDANGCAASQSFTVTEPPALSVTAATQTNIACNGDATGAAAINTPTGGTPGYTYDWDPGTPTGDGTTSITGLNAGTWTCNVMDANGCNASQSFTITQPAAITNTLIVTSCDSYTLNGTTYSFSGTYTQVLTSVSGCDSTLTLNLTINYSTTETLNATSCSSYTLNGTTYTTSGTYTQLLTNAAGCDSTITLNLIINQPTSASLTESACDSYTLNGTTYTTSGTYTQLFTNAAGCDSTLTLILTINMSTVSTLTETGCDSYSLNGSTYTTSGVYTQVIGNAAGCDSTITLNLTINNSSTSTLVNAACESYTLNGQTYTASGTYTQTLTNSMGCDSIITLNLIINSADADTTLVMACDSYVWNGQTFTTSGFYTVAFTNANGCDSIENLDLTIVTTPVAGITSL
ncbi:MAG: gliding motility-related protein, partial [Fluviicola sp.]|uniref:beta strand repeat-containing protein n=1 Tax=Fluviicola sp. TaxID=1917219 RepID=UPI002608058E